MINELEANQTAWTDTSFVYPESIAWEELPQVEDLSISHKIDWVDWQRLSEEERMEEFTMWGTNEATFDDSIQGYLGDCWLVASSTSLFNDASRLDDIFLVKEINEVGVYAFKFHLLGMPITVIIDDYVPFDVDYPDYLLFG